MVERYEYDVYGEAQIFDGSGSPLTASAIGNPYLFTGRRYDPESGNYYYRARMYSPILGRFVQMDPLGFEAGDLNLYRYVFNSPLNFIDPEGKTGIEVGVALLVVKALAMLADYGWTAWDIYQAEKVLKNPCASFDEKLQAAAKIALAAVLEAVEADECFPINVPLDDLGQKILMSGVQEAIEKGGKQALEKFLQKHLKKHLAKAARKTLEELLVESVGGSTKYQGHHWWPKELGGADKEGELIDLPSANPNLHTKTGGIHPEMRDFLREQLGVDKWKQAKAEWSKLDFDTQKGLLEDFYESQCMKMPDMKAPGIVR